MAEQVFISYSSKDGHFVSRLSNALGAKGYSVWFDKDVLEVGDRWREEIVTGIKSCEAFVLLLSDNSIESLEIVKELSLAEENKRPIFPIMLGETTIPDRLAYQLAGIQYDKFAVGQDEKNLESLVGSLVNAGVRPAAKSQAGHVTDQFFARDDQLTALRSALENVLTNTTGAASFVVGSAGTGKTALVEEFLRQSIDEQPALLAAIGGCNARTGLGDPYQPFREILCLLVGDIAETTAAEAVGAQCAWRLRDQLQHSTGILLDHAPDLIGSLVPSSNLLNTISDHPGVDPVLVQRLEDHMKSSLEQGSELNQEQIQSNFVRFLQRLSQTSPLLLVVEDLQWADLSSIQLIFHLFRELEGSPVLLIGTYRPTDVALGRGGERHPLDAVINEIKGHAGDVWIDLNHLEPSESRDFVDALLDSEPNKLDEAFRNALANHTGGNALFCGELVQSMQEGGDLIRDPEGNWIAAGEVNWTRLPARTEAVLKERIARLGENELDILRVASVEGSIFTAELIAKIENLNERELIKSLSRNLGKRHGVVSTATVERNGTQWMSRYRFVQTHLQRYLYNDLETREKMIFHEEFGALLEGIYEGRTDQVAPQLALHFDAAGNPDKAIHYLRVAAERALKVSGYGEARLHVDRALELVESLEAGTKRNEVALDLLVVLSTITKALTGWGSPETREIYDRARDVAKSLEPTAASSPILFGIWAMHLMRLDLEDALVAAQECMDLAVQIHDSETRLQAAIAKGNTLYWMGEFEQSGALMTEALDLFDESDAEAHLLKYGQDSRVVALMFLALTTSIIGDAEGAAAYRDDMLTLAQQLNHPFTSAIALQGAALMELHLNRPDSSLAYATSLVELSREKNFPFYLGVGLVIESWAAAKVSEKPSALDSLEEGFDYLKAGGNRLLQSLYHLARAEILLEEGRIEEGLGTIEKGLAGAKECSEHAYESELLRLQAQLLAALPEDPIDKAGEALAAALEVATQQGAKTFVARIELTSAQFQSRRLR